MEENEAIKILKEDSCYECVQGTNSPVNCEYGKCRVADATRVAIKALEEIEQYRAIGTPEECKAAVEKQTAKLVIDNTPTEDSVWYQCPTCKGDLTTIRGFYCQYCGQKLHWR